MAIGKRNQLPVEGASWTDPDLRNWKVADGVNFDFAWAG
jgi:hypothetical protein